MTTSAQIIADQGIDPIHALEILLHAGAVDAGHLLDKYNNDPRLYYSSEVETCAVYKALPTSAPKLIINPGFWQSLTHQQRLGLLWHESLHISFGHMQSRAQYPQIHNVAADCVINRLILSEVARSISTWIELPPGGITPDALIEKYGIAPNMVNLGTTQQIYEELLRLLQLPDNPSSASNGMADAQAGRVGAPQNKVITEMPEDATDAATHNMDGTPKPGQSKSPPGKPQDKPGGAGAGVGTDTTLLRVEDEQNIPDTFRRLVLSLVRATRRTDERSFRRPSRRSQPGLVQPAQVTTPIPTVAVYLDISGSMDWKLLKRAYTAIDMVRREYPRLEVFLFNTEVKPYTGEHLRDGGTNFQAVFESIQTHKKVETVFITDGDGTWPDELTVSVLICPQTERYKHKADRAYPFNVF
jgi:hypothetical protein